MRKESAACLYTYSTTSPPGHLEPSPIVESHMTGINLAAPSPAHSMLSNSAFIAIVMDNPTSLYRISTIFTLQMRYLGSRLLVALGLIAKPFPRLSSPPQDILSKDRTSAN